MSAELPARWQLTKRLLLEALSQPEEKRRAFLVQTCGRDNALYAEVESLLAHQEEAERTAFLEVSQSQGENKDTAGNSGESPLDGFDAEQVSGSRPAEEPQVMDPDEMRKFGQEYDIFVTAASAEQIVALWNSRYDVVEEVAEGAMGRVFRGRHLKLGMDVAIKVLKEGSSNERFLREARALAQIKSPYVVRIHDFDILRGGVPIIIMEWIDGPDLRQRMSNSGGRIIEANAVPWMRQVCEGMKAAAAEGIIHRDLKPSNILIDGRNQVRVADFGLVRHPEATDDLSLTGNVMGTPYYMAPEQAEDPRNVDSRADIYSFGATFYHALTGEPPFSGKTPFATLFKHKTAPLISPKARYPAISERTSQILERCLAKSPADRFQSFTALLQQLESSAAEASPWDATDEQDFAEFLSRYRARRAAFFEFPRAPGLSDIFEFPDDRSIHILVGDLTKQKVDVLVSSDAGHLRMETGVAAAIRKVGGKQIAIDAKRFAPVRPGRAIVTLGGKLQAKFIFHAVTMGVSWGHFLRPSPDLISEILSSCFYHADTLDLTSIAFPLLGTGAGGFPEELCLDTIFRFLCRTLGRGMTCVREARIVLVPAYRPKLYPKPWEGTTFSPPEEYLEF